MSTTGFPNLHIPPPGHQPHIMALQDAVPKQLVGCPFHTLSSDGGLAEEGQSGGHVRILCWRLACWSCLM